jgi:cytochrome c553
MLLEKGQARPSPVVSFFYWWEYNIVDPPQILQKGKIMMKRFLLLITVLVLGVVLAACGGGSAAPENAGGDATKGKELYSSTLIGSASAPGCVTCHYTDKADRLVGPSHMKIGAEAGSRVAGMTAEQYLEDSIRNPNAHVAEGETAGVMYQNYGTELTDQEIKDLVAYLLTLK